MEHIPPSQFEPNRQPGYSNLSLSWSEPQGLVGLSFLNFFLRIITLGIYNFWGKTEVRKRVWSSIRLNGEPLEYTGTGKELFLGFLVIFGVILLPVLLLGLAVTLMFGPIAVPIYQLVVYFGIFYLFGVGIYRAQRYRLSRTRWRGIRGGLENNSWSYGWTYLWTAMLIPMTMGWILPWRATKLQKDLINDTRFGTQPFNFVGTASPLYGRFIWLWVAGGVIMIGASILIGAVIGTDIASQGQLPEGQAPQLSTATNLAVFGIAALGYLLYSITSAWYRAFQMNYFASCTRFGDTHLIGTARAGGLVWLAISNFVITILTLGILAPVAQARVTRYIVQNLSIDGQVALEVISQGAEQKISIGEGLAQAFDVDAF